MNLTPTGGEAPRRACGPGSGSAISALALVVLIALHLTLTYRPLIQFLLLLVLVFHATLGLRVILLDFGVVHVRYQKALIAGLGALGILLLVLVWIGIY